MTGISWTDEVWNPTTGCDRISHGCDNCYALAMAKRLKGMGQAKYQTDGDPRTSGPGFGLAVHEDALDIPYRWRKPRRVFVNSMSDLGHARIPREFTARVWSVMAGTPKHSYQILSKRPEHLRSWLGRCQQWDGYITHNGQPPPAFGGDGVIVGLPERWPLPNVWLGTSIELDKYARRADDLRESPAAIRFLSLEPLLGPLPSLSLDGIDWVILGGESGADHRTMDIAWLEQIVTRCQQSGIPVWVKQDSGPKPGQQGRIPDWLWLHQFPQTADGWAA